VTYPCKDLPFLRGQILIIPTCFWLREMPGLGVENKHITIRDNLLFPLLQHVRVNIRMWKYLSEIATRFTLLFTPIKWRSKAFINCCKSLNFVIASANQSITSNRSEKPNWFRRTTGVQQMNICWIHVPYFTSSVF